MRRLEIVAPWTPLSHQGLCFFFLLVFLTGCSFHSVQLNFVKGVLKELNTEKTVVHYWMLEVPAESLKVVPIVQSNQIFFSDGEKYLVRIGEESIEEIKALDTGAVKRLFVRKAGETGSLISDESTLVYDSALMVYRQSTFPDKIYLCSDWEYLPEEGALVRLCENNQGGMLKFTHDLDDLGAVKRFNVTLENQLLIDLERTDESISY